MAFVPLKIKILLVTIKECKHEWMKLNISMNEMSLKLGTALHLLNRFLFSDMIASSTTILSFECNTFVQLNTRPDLSLLHCSYVITAWKNSHLNYDLCKLHEQHRHSITHTTEEKQSIYSFLHMKQRCCFITDWEFVQYNWTVNARLWWPWRKHARFLNPGGEPMKVLNFLNQSIQMYFMNFLRSPSGW